jgi:conjugative transfer region protein TrbK
MRKMYSLLTVLLAAACGKTGPSDTIESLAADPDRLKEVMRQCRRDHAEASDPRCIAASEAFRRRFMGDGNTHYTPRP